MITVKTGQQIISIESAKNPFMIRLPGYDKNNSKDKNTNSKNTITASQLANEKTSSNYNNSLTPVNKLTQAQLAKLYREFEEAERKHDEEKKAKLKKYLMNGLAIAGGAALIGSTASMIKNHQENAAISSAYSRMIEEDRSREATAKKKAKEK